MNQAGSSGRRGRGMVEEQVLLTEVAPRNGVMITPTRTPAPTAVTAKKG